MTFLGGRLSASEGKYFKEESELAAARLRKELKDQGSLPVSTSSETYNEAAVDMLPEILQHSRRLSAPHQTVHLRESTGRRPFDDLSKAEVQAVLRSANTLYGHVPQARLGRSRFSIDMPGPYQGIIATANQRRQGTADPKQVHSLVKGLGLVSKAFLAATILVYGGGILAVVLACRSMGVQQLEDIPEKGQEAMQPRIQALRDRMAPIREWVEERKRVWSMTEEEQRAVGRHFADAFGVKQGTSTGEDGAIEGEEGNKF